MGVLRETIEKLLRNFISLKEDDWVQWIAQENDWQAYPEHNGGGAMRYSKIY